MLGVCISVFCWESLFHLIAQKILQHLWLGLTHSENINILLMMATTDLELVTGTQRVLLSL